MNLSFLTSVTFSGLLLPLVLGCTPNSSGFNTAGSSGQGKLDLSSTRATLASTTALLSYNGTGPQLQHANGFASGTAWATNVSYPANVEITYGPYTSQLGSGNFLARFTLMIDNNSADNLKIITVDVNDAAHGHVLMALDINRQDFNAPNTAVNFDVPFYAPSGASLEFRVFYWGSAAIQHLRTQVFSNQIGLPASLANPPSWPSSESYPIPAKNWMVGFNELFSLESAKLAYQNIPGIPGNSSYRGLPALRARVMDLAGQHHVGLYRDIVSLSQLATNGLGDQSGWGQVIDSIDMFRNYNLNLVLSIGQSIPQWMVPPGGLNAAFCPGTAKANDWPQIKNSISLTVGGFLAAVAAQDPNRKAWMQTHLFIEPWNEVDSPAGPATQCSTPQQAADLANGIAWVMNSYGLHLQLLAPSLVEDDPSYLQSYYAAGGTGLPNLHIYFPPGQTVAQDVAFMESQLTAYQKVVPPGLANRIMVSEIGVALRTAANMSDTTDGILSQSDRMKLYSQILADPMINGSTEGMIFWRLYDLPLASGLYARPDFGAINNPQEPYFGSVSADGSTYNPEAQSIFMGLAGLSSFAINAGQVMDFNGYALTMQADCNLVLYNTSTGAAVWAASNLPGYNLGGFVWNTSTGSCPNASATFQDDGNLVLYNPSFGGNSNHAYWASGTGGNPGAQLQISASSPYLAITRRINQLSSLTPIGTLQLNAGNSLPLPGYGYFLAMQSDCNLVLYNTTTGAAVWATSNLPAYDLGGFVWNTSAGSCLNASAAFQGDGNLVLYNPSFGGNAYHAYWASGTGGNPGAQLQLMSSGQYVSISVNGKAIWHN